MSSKPWRRLVRVVDPRGPSCRKASRDTSGSGKRSVLVFSTCFRTPPAAAHAILATNRPMPVDDERALLTTERAQESGVMRRSSLSSSSSSKLTPRFAEASCNLLTSSRFGDEATRPSPFPSSSPWPCPPCRRPPAPRPDLGRRRLPGGRAANGASNADPCAAPAAASAGY